MADLISMERCPHTELKFPQNLWVCILMASAYIRNCYYRNTRKAPYESFTSLKPNLNKMNIFRTTCFYVQNKTKLDPHCEKAFLLAMISQVQLI